LIIVFISSFIAILSLKKNDNISSVNIMIVLKMVLQIFYKFYRQ